MTSRVHLHPLAFPVLSALLLVAAAPLSRAYADPIPVNVTSGSTFLSISGGEELSFGFFLPGVGDVRGYTAVDQGLHAEAFPAPLSLASGDPYTVSSAATFSSGQIMLDGVYGPVIPAWRVSGDFAFRGGTGPLVSETMDWGTRYVATAPFLFTGILNQYDWATGARLHTFLLTGSGTGRAFLFDGLEADTSPFVGYLQYDFAEPQPVPEPATLLLVAAGLTAAFARRMESGRRRH